MFGLQKCAHFYNLMDKCSCKVKVAIKCFSTCYFCTGAKDKQVRAMFLVSNTAQHISK